MTTTEDVGAVPVNEIVRSIVQDAMDSGDRSDDMAALTAQRIDAYYRAGQEPRGCPTPGACSCIAPAPIADMIEAAILAERERCARIADDTPLAGVLTPGWLDGASSAATQIAAAIRAGEVR